MRKKYISGLVAGLLALASFVTTTPMANAADPLPTTRLVSPSVISANETFAADGFGQWFAAGGNSYYEYIGAGSTVTLTYLVTLDGSTVAAGKDVSFLLNLPYSGSNATWQIDGKAVSAAQNTGDGYGIMVKGKTNSEGKISFTIKNTNDKATAEAIPTSITQPRPSSGRVYGNMKLVIDGIDDMHQAVDFMTYDITKADAQVLPIAYPTLAPKPVVKATTITCIKGKLVKKVTAVNPKCPTGYNKK